MAVSSDCHRCPLTAPVPWDCCLSLANWPTDQRINLLATPYNLNCRMMTKSAKIRAQPAKVTVVVS
ncbi:hypothetical protein EMGBD4_15290 [Verrucomicrobiota bacterium]|nr:hypothetical protein EMGBD4_15290 [Verrucomicrobiota bacterium]